MKTFKTLCVGDNMFRIVEDYRLGNPEYPQIEAIPVHSIEIIDKNIVVNKKSSYSSGYYYDLVLPVENANDADFKYKERLIFVDSDNANEFIRKVIVCKIEAIEKSIPEMVNAKKKEIATLREAFHEILNPSFYYGYKALTS